MHRFRAFLVPVVLGCFLSAAGQSKKAMELIYDDVQILKQRLLKIEEKADAAVAGILSLAGQVRDLQAALKLLQADQAGSKQGLQGLTAQNQVLVDRLDSIGQQLTKLAEDILAWKPAAPAEELEPVSGGQTKPAEKPRERPPAKTAEASKDKPRETTPPSTASHQAPKEVYDMAYADYIKGNYSLAIDGFRIYREQFPDSPLADNALYWVGECFFSQRKFEEAIEQFNLLLFDFPQGDKVPAAYLKKGLCFLELNKKEEALSVFKLLIAKYPNEDETKIAQEKIKEIIGTHEGHQQP